MTTKAQLRKAALSLPETTEGTHFGMLAFAVRGKNFISLTDDGLVQLHMNDEQVEDVMARLPVAERLTRFGKQIGVRVPLADVNGMQLNSLVEKSWLSRAPKRLAAARQAAIRGEAPGGAHDLPTSIGKPATRALLGAGITSLDDVAARSEAELAALHGVGSKALKLLAEELAARGLAFSNPGG